MPEFSNELKTYVISAIIFLAGLITKHMYGLWRNKMPRLQYSINTSALGKSGQDNLFGKVQITYNEKPVKNLFLCDLTLVNNTNRDFKDIEITVWCGVDSTILISHANKTGTLYSIQLTEKFVEELKATTEVESNVIRARREYNIPILNRDESVTFSCSVTSESGAEPNIYLDCDHPGVKLEANFVQPKLFWGENQGVAALLGLFQTSIVSIFVVQYVQSKALVGLIVYLLATLLIFPGAFTMKISKKLKSLFR